MNAAAIQNAGESNTRIGAEDSTALQCSVDSREFGVATIIDRGLLELMGEAEKHDDICAACYKNGQTHVRAHDTLTMCSFCNEVCFPR